MDDTAVRSAIDSAARSAPIPRRRKVPEPTWRIPTHTAFLMIALTFFVFDGAQVMGGALAVGGGLIHAEPFKGAIAAYEFVGAVGDFTQTATAASVAACPVTGGTGCIGGFIGAAIRYVGVEGVQYGIKTLFIDPMLQFVWLFLFVVKTIVGWVFLVTGFFAMWLWFKFRGVSLFAGNLMSRKVAASVAVVIVGVIPFVNDIPDLTLWVSVIILCSWHEDKERHDKLLERHQTEEAQFLRAHNAYSTRLS